MDTKYHIKIVNNQNTGYTRSVYDNELVKKANLLYDKVESAMHEVVSDGDYEKYISAITDYDEFVWRESHKGDKQNIFAYKKIKVSPTWTEQIWAVVFERVRKVIEEVWGIKLVVIQNKSVVESYSANGPTAFKDVDVGLGIVVELKGYKNPIILPVVVVECKTGHFCKTSCTNVDAIIRRVRNMNNNVLAFCVTDNKITPSKDAMVDDIFSAGGSLIQQRGVGFNKKDVDYPELNYQQFELVEKFCINYLKSKSSLDFTEIKGKKNSGKFLRESIDSKGFYIPADFEKFL